MRKLAAVIGLGVLIAASSCSATTPPAPAVPVAVPAVREVLTTDRTSPVVHDNEVMALADHAGRLFAATDQWEYQGSEAYGQILVKDTAGGPWRIFEQTRSIRVQALVSFPIPADQGLGPGHSLLVTQAIVDGKSRIQWLLDGAGTFDPADSYVLPTGAAVRSFGVHESGREWAVYAGAEPSGILRGVWSPTRHTLEFSLVPELTGVAPGSPGLKTRKITAFADCAGALYATMNTTLYRRIDGVPPRWIPVFQEGPVGRYNSGLRGLSCVRHDGKPSLLLSAEGSGEVHRFDHLSQGQLTPVSEFAPVSAIRRMLAARGSVVPASGPGSIGYVIAAYNDITTVPIDGVNRQVFGFEWGYQGERCAPARACGPTAFGTETFDAAACFAIRTDHGSAPSYSLHCLTGPDFMSSGQVTDPIRAGQAFVSIRTVRPSPFGDDHLYFGGYDCNFHPADGTAWVASAGLRLTSR